MLMLALMLVLVLMLVLALVFAPPVKTTLKMSLVVTHCQNI